MRFRWRRRSRRLLKLHRNERSPDPIIEVVPGPKPDFGSGNHTVREHTSPSGERCLSSVAVSRHGGQLPTEGRRNNFGAVKKRSRSIGAFGHAARVCGGWATLRPIAYSSGPHKRACKKHHKAKLVIAKLDRLSRNVAFIANLLEAGTDFVAADNPNANKAMVQMMAVFAGMERDAISKRTKEALAAAKARGVKLGNPRLAEAIATTNAARTEAADRFAANVRPISAKYRKAASAACVESPKRCLRVV
jgi:hypothetical protein